MSNILKVTFQKPDNYTESQNLNKVVAKCISDTFPNPMQNYPLSLIVKSEWSKVEPFSRYCKITIICVFNKHNVT